MVLLLHEIQETLNRLLNSNVYFLFAREHVCKGGYLYTYIQYLPEAELKHNKICLFSQKDNFNKS